MPRLDPHSYNDSDQPHIETVDWKARVDFATRTLDCEVVLSLSGDGPIDLDTRDLTIGSVTDPEGCPIPFTLFPAEPILGARLRVSVPPGTRRVSIHYRTSPTASALQWLTPAQTFGGQEPFLFSQCQAIHARSVIPLQDTPRIRITYRAELCVPSHLRALMAAAFVSRREEGDISYETYEMPQPIPPYLLALAVGALELRELGPRSRVWGEPGVVDRAAWEFAGVDDMIKTAESLFGPYDWQRFDILTMPPSFPYGGMENPRLIFVTPTLLAGDRSLVNVVAHELAHSWTGNLVSNASAEHFWLNEGFTVFAERRILEALEGTEDAALHAALGRRELLRSLARFADRPELTRLHTNLAGIDPDEAFSSVPYEKGYLFLRALEDAVGRDAFWVFLRKYVETFQFQAITTDDFLAFVKTEIPAALDKVNVAAWVNEGGIPKDAPVPHSAKLDALERLGATIPEPEAVRDFSPTEWTLYLESLPRPVSTKDCETLDRRFKLTRGSNYEVLVAWLEVCAESNFQPAMPRIEDVLARVGRIKYLRPLYLALTNNAATHEFALKCFDRFKEGYHPIARQVVEGVLRQKIA